MTDIIASNISTVVCSFSDGAQSKIECIILGVSDDIAIVSYIDGNVELNGFGAIRVRDIVSQNESVYAKFYSTVLNAKGFYLPTVPSINFESMESVISGFGVSGEVVSFEFERDCDGSMFVGRVLSVRDGEVFEAQCISPIGEEYDEADEFSLDKCTKVSFRGEYERSFSLYRLILR